MMDDLWISQPDFFYQVFEESPNSLIITDTNGIVLYVNKSFSRSSGYLPDEVLNKKTFLFNSGILDQSLFQNILDQLSNGLSWQGTLCNNKKDGTLYWEKVSAFPIKKSNNLINNFVVIKTDISELQFLHEELNDIEKRYQYLLDLIPDATLLVDSKLNIVSYNQKAKDFFLTDSVFQETFTIDNLYISDTILLSDLITKKRLFENNQFSRFIESKIHYYDIIIRNLPDSNDLTQIVIQDITKQKEDDQLLKNALWEAKNANLYLSRFLSHISTEIKSPVQAILGYTKLINEAKIPYPFNTYQQKIQETCQNLLFMIQDISELAQIDSNQVKIADQQTNLLDFLSDSAAYFKPKIVAKNLQFNLQIQEGLPKIVFTDKLRLKYILFNLLSNAVQYTQEGAVSLIVQYSVQNELLNLVIKVKDSGPGISPDIKDFIFTPVKSSGSNTYSTGLGLAIAKKMIQYMKGDITFTSSSSGSEFSIILNDMLFDNQEYYTSELQPVHYKILCIDDDLNCLSCYKLFLSPPGYNLLFEFSAETGLKTALSQNPNLIILDYHLPDNNGYEFLMKMKNYPELTNTPVIITSAESSLENFNHTHTLNYKGFLGKPLIKDELTTLVNLFYKKYLLSQKNSVPDQDLKNPLTTESINLPISIKNKYQYLKEIFIIEDIQSFSQDLLFEADQTNHSALKNEAQMLIHAINVLDIRTILKVLKELL